MPQSPAEFAPAPQGHFAAAFGGSGAAQRQPYIFNIAISGSVQYLVGMEHAGCILSINHTKGAPSFDVSLCGAVADDKAVIPALAEEMKRRKA